jgi:uncharacterized membrane protein YbhN (UPF0104 family)
MLIQVTFYLAVIWFVAQRFNQLVSTVKPSILLNRPLEVGVSAVCFMLFYGLMSVHWKRICDNYVKFPQQQQWLAFFASQPYKYLPSSLFSFSSRAVYAQKLGLPLKQSSLVQIIENLNILLGGFTLAVILLAYVASPHLGILISALGILALAAARRIPLVRVPKTAYKIAGNHWVELFYLSITAWFFAGLAFYFMVLASGTTVSLVSAIAANALAMGLGIIAIFAPGGIGVREFVYSKFSISSTGIIMWRLWTIFIDVVVGLVAILLINRRRGPE